MEEACGVRYSPSQVVRILHSLNFSWQKPEGVAREHDGEKVRERVKDELQKIKKLNETNGLLLIEGESGLSLIPLMGRTWVPVGKTPTMEYNFNWKRLVPCVE